MDLCPVCDGTGKLLDTVCPLCDGQEAPSPSKLPILSDDDIRRLQSAVGVDVRKRIFRSLALRCHPDRFFDDSERAEATQLFQNLVNIRDEASQAYRSHMIGVFDSSGTSRLCVLRQRDVVHGLTFSQSGHTAASCGDSGRLMLWKRLSGSWDFAQAHAEIKLSACTALAVAFLSNSYVAVVAGKSMEVWHTSEGTRNLIEHFGARAMSIAASWNSGYLAVGLEDGSVQIWHWCDEQQTLHDDAELHHVPVVDGVSWGCGGDILGVAGGATVSVWHQHTGEWEKLATLAAWQSSCKFFCVAMTGMYCAAGGTDGFLAVWRVCQGLDSEACASPSTPCDGTDASDVDSCSSTASGLDNGQELIFFRKHSWDERVAVNSVSLDSSGRCLASGGTDSRVILWCIRSQDLIAIFTHHLTLGSCSLCTATVNATQFAPDGKTLIAGGYDGMVTFWKVPQFDCIAEQ